jgi:hypothetical protein
MGRLTEALDFYNMSPLRSEGWCRAHYNYFEPTTADFLARKKYQEEVFGPKKAKGQKGKTKRGPRDIFA